MRFLSSLDWLRRDRNKGYWSSRIPNARDHEITALIETWMNFDEMARKDEKSWISEDQRFTLMAYSERMASLAVRSGDKRYLLLGLVALGVDNWRFDFRDNLRVVSTFYDAALRIGIPPQAVFEEAATLLPDDAVSGLREFSSRSASDKSIDAMDYTTENATDGFRYISKW